MGQAGEARATRLRAGDKAHMESFFHSLKAELTRGAVFIDTRRLHSSLGYRSLLAFEEQTT